MEDRMNKERALLKLEVKSNEKNMELTFFKYTYNDLKNGIMFLVGVGLLIHLIWSI